jgi:threonine/homoserine efflux transporter RhtA
MKTVSPDFAFTLADFAALHGAGFGVAVALAFFGALAFATLANRYL